MSTAKRAVTACDGPGCKATHDKGEHVIASGWLIVDGQYEQGDFCGIGCLATWAMAKAVDLTGGTTESQREAEQ